MKKNIKIPGVYCINSGKQGKSIGILYYTHGDEPVGEKVFQKLLQENIGKQLISGKIIFIHMNIQASEKKVRCMDHNMNRIFDEAYQTGSYEFERLKILSPILDEIDIAIDLHSTSRDSDAFGLVDIKDLEFAKQIFSSKYILVDDMKQTPYSIGYFARRGKIGLGFEGGSHNNESGIIRSYGVIKKLLQITGIIKNKLYSQNNKNNHIILNFHKEIFPLSQKFKFTHEYNGFVAVKNNSIYAHDGEIEYKTPLKGEYYIGMSAKKPSVSDGAGFLFKKI